MKIFKMIIIFILCFLLVGCNAKKDEKYNIVLTINDDIFMIELYEEITNEERLLLESTTNKIILILQEIRNKEFKNKDDVFTFYEQFKYNALDTISNYDAIVIANQVGSIDIILTNIRFNFYKGDYNEAYNEIQKYVGNLEDYFDERLIKNLDVSRDDIKYYYDLCMEK